MHCAKTRFLITRSRESSELFDAREPEPGLFGGIIKGVGKIVGLRREEAIDEFAAREFEELDLDAREPGLLGGIIKGVEKIAGFRREDQGDELLAREFDEYDLESREPGLFGGIIKGVEKIAGFRREDKAEELFGREFDEYDLESREPGLFGGIIKGVEKIAGFRREDADEMFGREPEPINVGGVFKKALSFIFRDEESGNLYVRTIDADTLEARYPGIFGGIIKGVEKVIGFKREDEADELFGREFDEYDLESRDPGLFGGIIKGVEKIAGFRREDAEDVYAREPINVGGVFKKALSFIFRDEESGNIYVRTIDLNTLDAREPGLFGGIIKGVEKVIGFKRDGELYYIRDAADLADLD